mgnify:CR=1 FL=1
MQDQVFEVLREALENEEKEIDLKDFFREYEEWDSLARMALIAELDERFEVSIESENFEKLKTVGDLVNAVQRLRA